MTKIYLKYSQKFYDDITGYTMHQYVIPGMSDAVVNIPVEVSFPIDCTIVFGEEGSVKSG